MAKYKIRDLRAVRSSIFGAKGNRIIREVIKEAGKPLKGEALEKAVMSSRYKLGMKSVKQIAKYLKVNSSTVKNILTKYGASRGAASIGALGTLGAGAAVVGGWAYPAHKLGKWLGTTLEKRRIRKKRAKKPKRKIKYQRKKAKV